MHRQLEEKNKNLEVSLNENEKKVEKLEIGDYRLEQEKTADVDKELEKLQEAVNLAKKEYEDKQNKSESILDGLKKSPIGEFFHMESGDVSDVQECRIRHENALKKLSDYEAKKEKEKPINSKDEQDSPWGEKYNQEAKKEIPSSEEVTEADKLGAETVNNFGPAKVGAIAENIELSKEKEESAGKVIDISKAREEKRIIDGEKEVNKEPTKESRIESDSKENNKVIEFKKREESFKKEEIGETFEEIASGIMKYVSGNERSVWESIKGSKLSALDEDAKKRFKEKQEGIKSLLGENNKEANFKRNKDETIKTWVVRVASILDKNKKEASFREAA